MTKGLVGLVESNSAITDLIGTSPTRFYPRKLPQGLSTFPAVAFKVVGIDDRATMDSPSKYDYANVDLHCYGRTYSDVNDLWETLRKQLEYQEGTYNSVQIDDVIYMDSGQEDYLEDLRLWTKLLELKIAYIRTP